jgi:SAM-dependent methyltransferase
MHIYDRTYYEYINRGSIRSAEAVLPIVSRRFPIASVVDFGAGQCAWLTVWKQLGIADVTGIDGDYVDPSALLIARDRFVAADLTAPIRLGRTYDLVQSLEVAEHLPAAAAPTFIDTLTAHGTLILFSAAPPGQGGEYHVNEQPYSYWRALFEPRGYVLLDLIRPALANHDIEPWYKYNSFVYVRRDRLAELPVDVRRTEIAGGAPIPDVSPLPYRIRKSVIRALPTAFATQLAVLKKHWSTRMRPRTGSG